MIYLINIFIIALFSFLTLSALPYLRIFGVVPLIVPFFIISLSYFRKGSEPFLLAAFAGIFFDLYSSYPFGYYLFLFLMISLIVKYMFQEGMRSLSLWYYMIFSFCFMAIYYLSQFLYLYFGKAGISLKTFQPFIFGILVNLICVILLYAFSNWYFDFVVRLEDELKRR